MARRVPESRRERLRRDSKKEKLSRRDWLVRLLALGIVLLFLLSSLIALFVH
ncbi:MAG: hypothetical protein QW379_04735 [Thermoplasmata archaeon]